MLRPMAASEHHSRVASTTDRAMSRIVTTARLFASPRVGSRRLSSFVSESTPPRSVPRVAVSTLRVRPRTSFSRRRSSTVASVPPSFDYTALVASVGEIKSLGTPAKVDVVVQPDEHTLIFGMRTMDGKCALRVSWHPQVANVALSGQPPRIQKDEQLSFGEAAQGLLQGKVLLDANAHAAWERVCKLSFGDRPGGEVSHELLCEIMGRNSNAFILDCKAGDAVVACAYQVGEKQSSVRRLAIGYAYAPPPAAPGIDPTAVSDWRELRILLEQVAATMKDDNERGVDRCLVRAFRGMSPALAKTLICGASVVNGISVANASDDDFQAIYSEFERWIRSMEARDVRNAVWCEEFGQLLLHESPAGAKLPPIAGDVSVAGGPIGTLFGAVYGDAGEEDVFNRERARILQNVRSSLKKLASKEAAFRKQLDAAKGHEKLQEQADMLMAFCYSYKAGASSLEAQDFSTGEPVKIAVDPEIGPVGTAEAIYKKTRKLRRTADAIEPLMEQAASEVEYLSQVEFSILELEVFKSRDDLLFIEEVGAELVDGGFMKPVGKGAEAKMREKENAKKGGKPKTGKQSRRQEMMSAIRVYIAPSGKEVYVGRNSRGNEAVSLHFGQDQDVWFHVRGAPGAHVILRNQPGQTASDDDIQFAANLASFHSKMRSGGKVNVSYTSPKHVRKPAGARLGMVTMDRESVIVARPDDVASIAQSD